MKPDEPFTNAQMKQIVESFACCSVIIAVCLIEGKVVRDQVAEMAALNAWGDHAERPRSRRTLAMALIRLLKGALPELEAFVDETDPERN